MLPEATGGEGAQIMASEIDRQFGAIMDELTAPGGPLECEQVVRGGIAYPAFKLAPPSLPAMFAATCAQHGAATFLVDGPVRLSFAETHALAARAAAGLIARHGIAPGDRIGIAARNSANWIILYMATLMAGGCVALLNGWWTGRELAEGIALTGCKLVLADEQRAGRLAGQNCDAQVLVFEHGDPEAGLKKVLANAGDQTALPEPAGDDLATILFTSGSTGACKGAWSGQRSVVQAAMSYAAQSLMVLSWLTAKGEAPTIQPVALVAIPLFHITAEVPLFLQSFLIGRTLVLMPKWDACEAMRLIEQEHVTYFVGVPLMSYEIATHPECGNFDLTSCVSFAAGGAPRPVEHVTQIRENLPHAFPLLGYGLTETNALGCANFNENYIAKPSSTGPVSRPIVELAILDDHGRALPPGVTGEIAFRSIANFGGYWNNPEATAAAVREDGFFLSGDLGYTDEDGYLFIVDRKKDIIIRGGENISCIEVEQALYAHPGVAEACVFGLAHARYGEVPVAVVFAKPDHAIDLEELRAFVAAQIAPFKVPEKIWHESEPLPRLGTEKVDKRALKARYADQTSGVTDSP
ncbi:MAG: class I adenylate-forming enzyme family protein [Novosphingobium sp.]